LKDRDEQSISLRVALLKRIIPPVGSFILRALMKTCRVVRVEGREREREALKAAEGRAVYATWHQRMAYFFYFMGPSRLTIMISRSKDGEYATRMAARLGFGNVRGSSSFGGARALIEMIRRVRKGECAGMLADGPQGPARVVKMGTIMIAQKSRAPILPLVYGVDRCWTFNSWDRYIVPKPFSRVVIHFGEPIVIPEGIRGDELERYRLLLEERLNRGARWCDEQFGPERPWRRAAEEEIPEIGPLIK
jgi:lysophospholipid acyltransferase (LPLAT)-like uncharacterized protein